MYSVLKSIYDTGSSYSSYLFTSSSPNMDGIAEASEKPWTPAIVNDSSRYSPSVWDVLRVKGFLFRNFNLPIELIDSLIDMAEYWPHTTTVTSTSSIIHAQRVRENQFILRSYPLGFTPTDTENQKFQMRPEYKDPYKSMEPKPWPESRSIPDDASEEVFKKWELRSRPRVEHPCRKIVFTIKSRDQGWGGSAGNRGTYKESYTWFDAGLEKVSAFRSTALASWETAPFPQFRLNTGNATSPSGMSRSQPDPPQRSIVCSLRTILPKTVPGEGETQKQDDCKELTAENNEGHHDQEPILKYKFHFDLNPSGSALQKNVTAIRAIKEHVITWSCDDDINPEAVEAKALEDLGRGRETGTGELVRNMKVGDVVTVWAKARYGGWANHVEEVKIDVYWVV